MVADKMCKFGGVVVPYRETVSITSEYEKIVRTITIKFLLAINVDVNPCKGRIFEI